MIPGAKTVAQVRDNAAAGDGRLPDEAGVTQMPDDCVVEQLTVLGRRRADKAGAPTLACVGEQREL